MYARAVGVLVASTSLACIGPPPLRASDAAQGSSEREAACDAQPLAASPPLSVDRNALAGPVTELRIDGTALVSTEFVRLLMTKTPSASLGPSELEGADTRLLAFGALESVSIHAEPMHATTLVVDVRERPRIGRVFAVGNATPIAIRSGLSPQAGDVFDRDYLVATARAIERSWRELGDAAPRVTLHEHRVSVETVDLCVRATAFAPYDVERAVGGLEDLRRELAPRDAPQPGYDDANLARYVGELGARVATVLGPDAQNVTFALTDHPSVHAEENPITRTVTISRGLVAVLGSEAQLAAVIGHELGHVLLRHNIVIPMIRALGSQPGATREAELDAYQQMQADRVAIDAVERLGYDPHEVLTALGTLLRFAFEQSSTIGTANYLLSRLARIRLLLHRRSGGRIEQQTYLTRIEGLRWGLGAKTHIRVRPATKSAVLADALAGTCPAARDLALVNSNLDDSGTITVGTPLKCLVSE